MVNGLVGSTGEDEEPNKEEGVALGLRVDEPAGGCGFGSMVT